MLNDWRHSYTFALALIAFSSPSRVVGVETQLGFWLSVRGLFFSPALENQYIVMLVCRADDGAGDGRLCGLARDFDFPLGRCALMCA
ncbi:hypothetical protein B0T24DRAFT_407933 [Lasiosphaeria ovina]|uniref:Secreted protein n=1 Tax=Lasiosphaeria ovina TaxID=92902 RepID=A0AAE0N1G5_9PEZI|nr:hypothetical protein B0T24DRAFT_407933 [Lasiosphaeria ovina]